VLRADYGDTRRNKQALTECMHGYSPTQDNKHAAINKLQYSAAYSLNFSFTPHIYALSRKSK
jgi:hypothetical protein